MNTSLSWLGKHKFLTALLVVFFLIFFIVVINSKKQSVTQQQTTTNLYPASGPGKILPAWATVRSNDPPQVAQGWSTPTRIAVSYDGSFEESPNITPNGDTLYFMYYPGDEFSAALFHTIPIVGPGVIYSSQSPFETMQRDTASYLSAPYYTFAGPFWTSNNALFYHSNAPIPGAHGRYLSHIYLNGALLPFNDPNVAYDNPDYCQAKDELWFDENDDVIYVLKNAAASGFQGTPEEVPAPINSYNSSIADSQPWLSPDCETMYFSSTRDHIGSGPFIYMSQRAGDNTWSAPQLVVKSNYAVGEPTLTANMNELFFEQILENPQGQFSSNLFYTQKD